MQCARAVSLPGGQAVAQRLVPLGAFEEAVEKRSKIKAGSPGHDREAVSRRDSGQRFARQTVYSPAGQPVGGQDVQKVMEQTFGGRWWQARRCRYRSDGRPGRESQSTISPSNRAAIARATPPSREPVGPTTEPGEVGPRLGLMTLPVRLDKRLAETRRYTIKRWSSTLWGLFAVERK